MSLDVNRPGSLIHGICGISVNEVTDFHLKLLKKILLEGLKTPANLKKEEARDSKYDGISQGIFFGRPYISFSMIPNRVILERDNWAASDLLVSTETSQDYGKIILMLDDKFVLENSSNFKAIGWYFLEHPSYFGCESTRPFSYAFYRESLDYAGLCDLINAEMRADLPAFARAISDLEIQEEFQKSVSYSARSLSSDGTPLAAPDYCAFKSEYVKDRSYSRMLAATDAKILCELKKYDLTYYNKVKYLPLKVSMEEDEVICYANLPPESIRAVIVQGDEEYERVFKMMEDERLFYQDLQLVKAPALQFGR